MLTLSLALLVAAAPPAAGSRWKWSYDDSRKAKLLSGPKGGTLETHPHLEKTELEFSVDELGSEAPRVLTVKVLKGPSSLAGRTWKAESNYGEAVLTEVGKKKQLDELQAAMAELQEKQIAETQRALQHVLSTLFTPDPIVAAAATEPCSDATRGKIAKAAGKLAAKLVTQRPDDLQIEKASAQCVGSGGKYTVAFTLTAPTQDDQKLVYPWVGTIEIPAGAWRASIQLSCSTTVELKTTATPIRVQTQLALKSALSPRK